MNHKLILSLCLFSIQTLFASNTFLVTENVVNNITSFEESILKDRIDTIYYDNNWRVINNRRFATYYRYALYPVNPRLPKKCRTFYSNGKLEGEGDFIELSRYNDEESKFIGTYVHYYKSGAVSLTCQYNEQGVLNGSYVRNSENGNILMTCFYKNGKLDGEKISYYSNGKPSVKCIYHDDLLDGIYTSYYESGLIHEHVNMVHGERDGIESVFEETGETCIQFVYNHGKRSNQYLMTNIRGNFCLYNTSDDSPVFTSPTKDDVKVEYKNGIAWPYYNNNGIIIGVSQYEDESLGAHRELHFFLSNNSMNNVDIDPSSIRIYSIKKGNKKDIKAMDSEEYYDKVYKKKKKNAKELMRKRVLVEKNRLNYLNKNLGATLFDNSSNTLQDFQQRMIKKEDLLTNNQVLADNEAENIEYLQRTTVHPNEAVSGYLLIDDKRTDTLHVDIDINGVTYSYEWDMRKKK